MENPGGPIKKVLRAEAHRETTRDGRGLSRDNKGCQLAQKAVAKVAKVRNYALRRKT